MENNRIDLCAPEGETPIYDQIRQELAGRIRAGSLPTAHAFRPCGNCRNSCMWRKVRSNARMTSWNGTDF